MPPTPAPLSGIHHITALASDPARNLKFYRDVLGLRLVKRTVNFDAPGVYHLYYGDETGSPGSILTFFPFPGSGPGTRGTGEAATVAFGVPSDSLESWVDRLVRHGVSFQGPHLRFGSEQFISFTDPDGTSLELVLDPGLNDTPGWQGSRVEPAHTLRGIVGTTMVLTDTEPSRRFLTSVLGFRTGPAEGPRVRLSIGEGPSRATVDLLTADAPAADGSAGSIHHLAWRVQDEAAETAWQQYLRSAGCRVTAVQDRRYFRSVYFHEPGGVLFEIATDAPGFLLDEDRGHLGSVLRLPPWLEAERDRIERRLPPLD